MILAWSLPLSLIGGDLLASDGNSETELCSVIAGSSSIEYFCLILSALSLKLSLLFLFFTNACFFKRSCSSYYLWISKACYSSCYFLSYSCSSLSLASCYSLIASSYCRAISRADFLFVGSSSVLSNDILGTRLLRLCWPSESWRGWECSSTFGFSIWSSVDYCVLKLSCCCSWSFWSSRFDMTNLRFWGVLALLA